MDVPDRDATSENSPTAENMHVRLSLVALALLSVVASAEFTLVGEFHGKNQSEEFGYEIDMDGDYAVVGALYARDYQTPLQLVRRMCCTVAPTAGKRCKCCMGKTTAINLALMWPSAATGLPWERHFPSRARSLPAAAACTCTRRTARACSSSSSAWWTPSQIQATGLAGACRRTEIT